MRSTQTLVKIYNNWNIEVEDVQQYWNVFENKTIKIIDEIVLMTNFEGGVIKEKTPKNIRNKISRHNRLLKNYF